MPNDNSTTTNNSFPLFISFAQLREIYGISRTTAYRHMKTLGFPRPIQMGPNAVRFRKSEIDQWVDSRPLAPVHGSKEVAA